jgi:hypothetical protein
MNTSERSRLTSDRIEAEAKIKKFIDFAQSIYREQRPYGDFDRYVRLLHNYLSSQFYGVVMPHNWEIAVYNIKLAWDDTSLLYPEAAIRDAIEDVLDDYVKNREY